MSAGPQAAPARPSITSAAFWNDAGVRGVLYQVLLLGGIAALAWYLLDNTMDNLAKARINTGFDYLGRESSFEIGESLIDYSAQNSYGRAILVGLLNTLKVSVIGIVLATILGTLLGIARLSTNWLVARLASVYVETIRNVPLLLQLFFWYALISQVFPAPRQALNPIPGVFLSNRGLRVPVLADAPGYTYAGIAFLIGCVLTYLVHRWMKKRQMETGQPPRTLLPALGLMIGLPLIAWLAGGAPTALDMPQLQGFNFSGGTSLTPEFTALLVGLIIYTAAFICEIVRSGILGVNHGQTEAAKAVGLTPGQTLRLVILPQALRLIVPPMTSQYLNLTKNSSLAIAIGYPDLVAIANISINQTGLAIENIALIMAVYLTISLSISLFMNWYNARIRLLER